MLLRVQSIDLNKVDAQQTRRILDRIVDTSWVRYCGAKSVKDLAQAGFSR